jgi:predicted metal-dependent phosphoesterase TrpH
MIDLHTHTTASDGTDKPFEMLQNARKAGLTVVAMTDHDSVEGWREVRSKRDQIPAGLTIVPGAEVSTRTQLGMSVHIVGLLFDAKNVQLAKLLSDTRDDRIPRMEKMIEKLQVAGYQVTMEDVEEVKPVGATLGRPHLADALIKNGIVASRDAAFEELLHNNSQFYVSHWAPSPIDAIKAIATAGGVSILAHPFAEKRGPVLTFGEVTELATAGLNGIERNKRDQDEAAHSKIDQLSSEHNLIKVGSSDYHGSARANQLGEEQTPLDLWENLASKASGDEVFTR